MYTRIMTGTERSQTEQFLREDGERTSSMRAIATRARQNLPAIEKDLELIRRLLKKYEKVVGAKRRR